VNFELNQINGPLRSNNLMVFGTCGMFNDVWASLRITGETNWFCVCLSMWSASVLVQSVYLRGMGGIENYL
jgi:hypothetical protein